MRSRATYCTLKTYSPRHSNVFAFIVTVAYLGRIGFAPGSWGALAALPAAYFMASLTPLLRAAICVLLLVASTWAVQRYLRATTDSDPQEIVIDEWIGCLIALAFVPWQPLWTAVAFALFRLLDIRKPWPVSLAEQRLPGAYGVIGDDVVAGLGAGLIALGLHQL